MVIVEGLCGLFLAVSAYALFTRRTWAWPAATAAHVFALAGVLLGISAIAAGRGPHTLLNVPPRDGPGARSRLGPAGDPHGKDCAVGGSELAARPLTARCRELPGWRVSLREDAPLGTARYTHFR